MVHALNDIRRVLVPDGYLIDLRPFIEKPPMEVVCGEHVIQAGAVDESDSFPDELAANDAIYQVIADDRFMLEQSASFELFTYWESPQALKDHVDSRDFGHVSAETVAQAEKILANCDPGAKFRTRLNMIIARYRKLMG